MTDYVVKRMNKPGDFKEHRNADGMLDMRNGNTTDHGNTFLNFTAKHTVDSQLRKIIQKEAKVGNF